MKKITPLNNYLGLHNRLNIFKEHILGSDLQVRTFQIIYSLQYFMISSANSFWYFLDGFGFSTQEGLSILAWMIKGWISNYANRK